MKNNPEVLAALQHLAEEGATESKGGRWSLGRLCDHLAKTMRGSLPGGDLGSPVISMWLRPLVKRAVLWTGWMPTGAPAPSSLVPEHEVSAQEGVDRLAEAVEAFDALPEGERNRMTPSPAMGPMSYDDWRKLHLIHARHHLRRFTGEK
ncbi:MAG: DUF1569 domain-containing protein [Phycisphaerae bacterium]|nr:DUF1569 domain-containing protein [Phycisphaerae bacterium]